MLAQMAVLVDKLYHTVAGIVVAADIFLRLLLAQRLGLFLLLGVVGAEVDPLVKDVDQEGVVVLHIADQQVAQQVLQAV